MLRKLSIVMIIIGVMFCTVAGISIINDPKIEKLTFSQTEMTITINESSELEILVEPENAKLYSWKTEWSSSNENIVTVDNGNITPINVGTASVFAKYDNTRLECKVTVLPILVDSITVDYEYNIIHPEETMQVEATIYPTQATYPTKVWSSSNPNVAIVSDTGLVTGVAEGEATITVASTNNVSKSFNIKVQNTIEVEKIEIEINKPANQSLTVSSYNLIKTIIPKNADNQTLTWTSSNPSVASVGNNGFLDIYKHGSATVTATTANGKSDSLHLSIPKVEAQSVQIKKPNGGTPIGYSMEKGQTIKLEATLSRSISTYPYITSSGITTRELIWTSSDPTKVAIDEHGNITALEITKYNNYPDLGVTITVKVKDVPSVSDTYIIYVI